MSVLVGSLVASAALAPGPVQADDGSMRLVEDLHTSVEATDDRSFSDVPPGQTFAEEIAWLVAQGITLGRDDGSFGVDDPVTRGSMAAFLYRFDGQPDGPFDAPDFRDVPAGHVFEQEIAWLASTGITQGRSDGSFGPGDAVTRGAMAAFLYRFDGEPDVTDDAPRFWDVVADQTFADEIRWLASTGITQGRADGSFGAGEVVSRGAMAAFLSRFDSYRRGEPLAPPETPPRPEPVDALNWRRVPHGDTSAADNRTSMTAVTAGGPGLVAVGHDNTYGQPVAAVWTSTDGRSWQRVPHDDDVFGSGDFRQIPADVTAGGPGLVAVGWDARDGAAVWTSVDGVSWQRIRSGAFDPDSDTYEAFTSLSAVTIGGPGLVAVGQDATDSTLDEGIATVAAVWTSVDGLTWRRAADVDTDLDDAYGQAMQSVIVGGPGLIAVGMERRKSFRTAAIWTSTDGLSWQRVQRDITRFGSRAQMDAVTTGGPGLVAVGAEFDGAMVWTSTNGVDWQRAPDGGDAFAQAAMSDVVAAGPGLVAVGNSWRYAPASSAPDGFEWQLGTGAVWTSPDGRSWSRVPHDEAAFGGDERQWMKSVTAGGPGLVAVGDDWGPLTAAVWTSP